MQFVKRVDAVFIPVKDVRQSEEWYQNIFQLVVVGRNETGVGFRFDQPWPLQTGMSIYESEDAGKSSSLQFNFYTEDVDGFHNYLKNQSVQVGEVHSEAGMRFFEFEDPSGNQLGAVTFKEFPLEDIKYNDRVTKDTLEEGREDGDSNIR